MRRLLALLALVAFAGAASAKFTPPQLSTVPVERLVANLETALAKKPDDVVTRFNLARLHAMAFATQVSKVKIRSGKEREGVWFGDPWPAHIPFRAQPAKDKPATDLARAHLDQAIAQYERIVKSDADHLSARLGLAWCIEQSGDSATAIAQYRTLIDDAWARRSTTRKGARWDPFIVWEAGQYLVPLLDPTTDAAELATVRARLKRVAKIGRPMTPIAIPLAPGLALADLVDADARVEFDADGRGRKPWSWITPRAGWLVDLRTTTEIDSALQLFGSVTYWLFWDNGYQPLAALDDNADGTLTGAELAGLGIWHDDGDGTAETGEVLPIAAWNIIGLAYHHAPCTDGRCTAYAPSGVTFADGSQRATYDLLLAPRK